MEPQLEPLQSKSKNLVPIVVSSVLVTALVAGGGVFAYQKSQNDQQTSDLQSQISTLQQQVTVLKTTTPTPLANSTPSPSATAQATAKPTPTVTTDLTASWKTYSNTAYGFSFKYPTTVADPENLGMSSTPATGDSTSFSIYVKNANYGKTGAASTTEFGVYTPTTAEQSMTLAQFVDKVTNGTLTKTTVSLGGGDAIKASFTKGGYQVGGNGAAEDGNDVIFAKHNNYYLYMPIKPLAQSRTQDTQILNSVLATFAFTK